MTLNSEQIEIGSLKYFISSKKSKNQVSSSIIICIVRDLQGNITFIKKYNNKNKNKKNKHR